MAKPKSTFTSYIKSSPDSEKSRFISYLESEDEEESSENADNLYDDNIDISASQFYMDLKPSLLPGEELLRKVDGVLMYEPYSDGKQGMSGNLCLTNFKLSFVTADRSPYEMTYRRQRNKLLNDYDIPLTSINSIYHVIAGGKRKKLTHGTRSVKTEVLEIYNKDLRVHKFSFRFTKAQKPQKKEFINVLVHHAFVNNESLLFAYEYGKNLSITERQLVCDIPTFESKINWTNELQRCGCAQDWRVAESNVSYCLSQSLPEYFVVPQTLSNDDLQKLTPLYMKQMFPVWCYTYINNISLLRMSAPEESGDQGDQTSETMKVLDSIKVIGNQPNLPTIVDLAECCPSCKDVQESYSKLKKLCTSDTETEFFMQDLTWYTSLEDTRWLQLVAQCLQTSQYVTDLIIKSESSVILQEQSGCDFSCLVASLVQILLDKHYRTMTGFQSLIEKEWVRMGHPFQKYLALVIKSNADHDEVPIFLLFLDCVWQLLQQFPSSFEFTETFLTIIWDTTHVGIFSTFLFNSDHQRFYSVNTKNESPNRQFRLPSAWKWDMQFNVEDLSFFKNPLYLILLDPELLESLSEIRKLSIVGHNAQSVRQNSMHKLLPLKESKVENGVEVTFDVLKPQFSAAEIYLWTQCFLRWQVPAQIYSGGTPASYLQQCHLVEEIIQFQSKIKQLQMQAECSVMYRHRSDLIFGHRTNAESMCITELLNSTYLTSSFPFTSGPPMKDQHKFTYTPTFSIYLKNTTLEMEKYDDEDDEVPDKSEMYKNDDTCVTHL